MIGKMVNNNKGLATAVVMLVLLAIGALSFTTIINSRMNSTSTENYKNKMQSFYSADGVMTYLAQEVIDKSEDDYLINMIHNQDIGTVVQAGSYGFDQLTDIDTIYASGDNLQGVHDACHFAYRKLKGDIDVTVRVVSLTNTSSDAMGGIMIRERLTSNTKCASILWPYQSPHNIEFRFRSHEGVSSCDDSTESPRQPGWWIRLKRSGNRLTGYRSSDGSVWSVVGAANVTMSDSVYVGLTVCSNNNTALCRGIFKDVTGWIRRSYTDSLCLTDGMNTWVKYTIDEVALGIFRMVTEGYKKKADGSLNHVVKLTQNLTREAGVSWHVSAPDSVKVPVTLYDFRSDLTNPEFNVAGYLNNSSGQSQVANFVENTLSSDKKPRLKEDHSGFREAFLGLFGSTWYSLSSCNRIQSINGVSNGDKTTLFNTYGAFTWDFCDSLHRWFRPSNAPGAVFDTLTGRWSNLVNRCRLDGTILPDEWVGINFDSTDQFANIVIYDSLTFRRKAAPDTGVYVFGDSTNVVVNDLDTQFYVPNCNKYCPYTFPSWPYKSCKKGNMRCASDTAMAFAFEPLKFMPLKNRGFKYQEDRYIPEELNDACVNSHNFSYTMELHSKFTYKPGQYFAFSGDDDVWVFIDNRLALDIGGIHGNLRDTIKADNLGLIEGDEYSFDMFYCERNVGASNILITTNMLIWDPPRSRKRSWKRDYGNLD